MTVIGNYKEKKLNWDLLIVIGFVLSQMTLLRIWQIGPGEMLILIWTIPYCRQIFLTKVNNIFLKFWFPFLIVLILSTCFGILFVPEQVKPLDLLTYGYFAYISTILYTVMKTKSSKHIEKILSSMVIVFTIVYLFLLALSWINIHHLFGYRLWFAGVRFAPFTNNPHQFALPALVVSVLAFRMIFLTSRIRLKILAIFLMIINWYLGSQTMSDTYFMSTVLIILSFLFLAIIYSNRNKKNKILTIIILISISFVVFILLYNQIYQFIYNWIHSDANGPGRIEIFLSIGETFSMNPFFGIGPGVHGQNGRIEFHNTYLEILAMSGIIGIILFVMFTIYIFKKIALEYKLVLVILPLYFYGFAGFAFRRLPYWIILAVICALGDAYRANMQKTEIGKEPIVGSIYIK